MVKIKVEKSLRDQLAVAGDLVELCDTSGRTLGHFVPIRSPQEGIDSVDCPYSDEELARMRREAGGRPLAEIWKALGRA